MYEVPVTMDKRKSASSITKNLSVNTSSTNKVEKPIPNNTTNNNALEKAQQMLNKYSNKTTVVNKASVSAPRKFDEDALSLDSEDDNENSKAIGFQESEESETFDESADLSSVYIQLSILFLCIFK
jgi:hypothetical protein